jgi:hypothetical protein
MLLRIGLVGLLRTRRYHRPCPEAVPRRAGRWPGRMCKGHKVAYAIVLLSAIDIVMGEVDRRG